MAGGCGGKPTVNRRITGLENIGSRPYGLRAAQPATMCGVFVELMTGDGQRADLNCSPRK
jgi:hypothetical protein